MKYKVDIISQIIAILVMYLLFKVIRNSLGFENIVLIALSIVLVSIWKIQTDEKWEQLLKTKMEPFG